MMKMFNLKYMKDLRKSFFALAASALGIIAASGHASAASSTGAFQVQIKNPLATTGTVDQIIDNIINFLLTIGIPIAGVMCVYAGFLFLTSGGDSKKIKTAKDTLIYAAVGIGILIISKGLVTLVADIINP